MNPLQAFTLCNPIFIVPWLLYILWENGSCPSSPSALPNPQAKTYHLYGVRADSRSTVFTSLVVSIKLIFQVMCSYDYATLDLSIHGKKNPQHFPPNSVVQLPQDAPVSATLKWIGKKGDMSLYRPAPYIVINKCKDSMLGGPNPPPSQLKSICSQSVSGKVTMLTMCVLV